VALLFAASCAGLHRGVAGPTDVALYQGRVKLRDGGSRGFRLLLFAAAPDRLHAEVLGPMGAPHLIVDGGGGRVAVAFPGEGVAYVGEAEPDVLGRVLGVPLSLDRFVGFLREGAPVGGTLGGTLGGTMDGLTLEREPEGPGLPRRLRVETGAASLSLRRREWRPSPPDPRALGTGTAPAGLTVEPLREMPDLGLPAIGADPAGR
jgi:hypothetical protein